MAFLLLLSAVVLIMVVMLGCGIGITTMIRRWLTPLSVLDFLETSKWGFGGDQPPIKNFFFTDESRSS